MQASISPLDVAISLIINILETTLIFIIWALGKKSIYIFIYMAHMQRDTHGLYNEMHICLCARVCMGAWVHG